jgi:hypothetical protein
MGGNPKGIYCTQTQVSIGVDTGSVTVSNVNIVSTTEITATVTPDASDPTETGCVTAPGMTVYMVVKAPTSAMSAASAAGSVCTDPNIEPIYGNTGITVQIVGCPEPTITEVKPSTWFAGKTYDSVVIKGTGFITTDKATDACPVTPVSITAADGSTVPVSNVNVESKTKITVGVAPPASDPTESATVTAGITPAVNSTQTYTAQILGNQILWNGNTISGDNATPQEVVIGQPINLTTLELPSGISATSNTWTVKGSNIGAYTVASDFSSATVTPTALKEASLNTYWIYPQDGITVTYKYCVNIQGVGTQCSPKATATFNVSGPTGKITFATSPSPETWDIRPIYDCNAQTGIYDLVFGWRNLGSSTCVPSMPLTTGINFTATLSDEPNSGGNVSWVQVISSDIFSGVNSNGALTKSVEGPGLDNKYPYPPTDPNIPNVAHDSPARALTSDYVKETDIFTAKMYLLWTSKIDSSIPVPLGYVKWKISGTGVYQPNQPSPWPWNLAPGASGTANFRASSDTGAPYYGMPHWTTVLLNTQGEDQMEVETESVPTDEDEENQ